ncbi:MAG TPA: o-succinylbenzoate synthase [Opitutaceae bacterium]|nr:o-succinylbenzoate synthase [Opitutaceae bacterium]
MTAFALSFRRYRLPFQRPVRTAHGLWREREGLILRLESPQGGVGWGEAAPLPDFGTESAEQAEAACRRLGGRIDDRGFESLPPGLPCLAGALAAARAEAESRPPPPAGSAPASLAVAALLPAGPAARSEIAPKAEAGFRTFKWKVGAADAADELALLDDLCAELPNGARLRLDANGAWDRRRAERWLERCAERPVEFVEQPVAAGARGAEDLLLGLAGDYPTPLALDESLAGAGSLARWLGAGWPGLYIFKPALWGDPGAELARLAAAKAAVVFSSALETAVGARSALRWAWAWPGPHRALGFGVWPLFADPRFDGPAAAAFLRRDDAGRTDPADLWTALD